MKTLNKTLITLSIVIGLSSVAQATCSTDVDMGGHKITNVTAPVNDGDVVNKQYMVSYMQETLYETMKHRFIRDNTKEVVVDITTNLMWQDNSATQAVTKQWLTTTNYNDCHDNGNNCYNTAGNTAATYCENLSLGGYDDWRMPSKEELAGIVKSTASNPAISNIFQHTASNFYWSSTTDAFTASVARDVRFNTGSQGAYYKSAVLFVRCVRAGQ